MKTRTATFNIRVLAAPQPPPPPPPPFVGSVLAIRVGEGLRFKLRSATLAEDCGHYTIDWGDGTSDTFDSDQNGIEHVYPAPGDYRVRISDEVVDILVGAPDDASDYSTIYAPMLTGFRSNGTRLEEFPSSTFRNCVNLADLDVAESALNSIRGAAFRNCPALSGELRFPRVDAVRGTGATQPFAGCPNVTALRFGRANEDAITSGAAYRDDPTLGTGVEGVCRFDL